MIAGVSLEEYFNCDAENGLWGEELGTGKASDVVQANRKEA